LEYANSVWSPHRQGLIKDLKKIQKRATKLVLTYKERLLQLKLPTLKYRLSRNDMTEVFKILTGKYDIMLLSVLKNIKIVEPKGII